MPSVLWQFLLLFTHHFWSCIFYINLTADLLEMLTGWTHWMPVYCMAAVLLLQQGSCLPYLFTWRLT